MVFGRNRGAEGSERQFFVELVAQEVLRTRFSQKLWCRTLCETVVPGNGGAGSPERQFFAEIVAQDVSETQFVRRNYGIDFHHMPSLV